MLHSIYKKNQVEFYEAGQMEQIIWAKKWILSEKSMIKELPTLRHNVPVSAFSPRPTFLGM